MCHWNLNSSAAHNFIKVTRLKACLSVHEMDIIFLSETYLGSYAPFNYDNLNIFKHETRRSSDTLPKFSIDKIN